VDTGIPGDTINYGVCFRIITILIQVRIMNLMMRKINPRTGHLRRSSNFIQEILLQIIIMN